jgi:3-oxoacyl-[acyl-carrier protein] reductase
MLLENKVSLITGANKGIGRQIVIEFAKEGSDIVFTDIKRDENTESLIEEVKRLGRNIIFFEADVRDFKRAEKVVEGIVEKFGKIDVLVNNAGINRDRVIWKMSEEEWDVVIDTDLKGAFNYIRAVVPYMRRQNYGRIINISSINGLRGKFGQANYSAAKAGLVGLTKTCAKELGKFGITCNAIAPGMIETDMIKKLPKEVLDEALKETVLGRFGKPKDVAYLAVFLASDRAKHITGEIIKVDGGQYI